MARAFLLSLLLLTLPTPVLATYRFDAWTADHGLPQNIVTGICQTKDGYLWIATLDGLARFDGVRFTVFDKNNSPGAQESSLRRDLRRRQRRPLALARKRRRDEVSRRTVHDLHDRPGRPGQELVGFTQDEAGRLLIVSPSAVRRYDPSLDRFAEIAWPAFATGYHRLLWDGPGIWGADEASLHLFDRGALDRASAAHGHPRADGHGGCTGPGRDLLDRNGGRPACHAANGVACSAAADDRGRAVNGGLSRRPRRILADGRAPDDAPLDHAAHTRGDRTPRLQHPVRGS